MVVRARLLKQPEAIDLTETPVGSLTPTGLSLLVVVPIAGAQAGVVVVAPGEHAALGEQRRGVVAAGEQAGDRAGPGPAEQERTRTGVAVLVVLSLPSWPSSFWPQPNSPSLGAGQAVVAPPGHDAGLVARGQLDLDRGAAVPGGAVAELAMRVVAPGIQLAGAGDGQAVVAAGAYRGHLGALGQLDLDRRAAVLGRAVTELAVLVETPRPARCPCWSGPSYGHTPGPDRGQPGTPRAA